MYNASSRGFASLALLCALFVGIGCGSDDSESSDGPAVQACNDMCDYDVSVAGDCPANAASDCKDLCKYVVSGLDANCQTTAEDYFRCRVDNKETASCNGGDLPMAVSPDACKTLEDQYVACMQ